jgi:serine protease Do
MKKNLSFIKVCALSILGGAIVGTTLGTVIPIGTRSFSNKISELASSSFSNTDTITDGESNGLTDSSDSTGVIPLMDEASKNTVSIIKEVKPSIACITTVTEGTDFFNQTYQSQDSGSGIVFSTDSEYAYIVTNSTVISGASKVSVSLNECDLVSASLVGKDSTADLAVISVKLSDLAKAGVNNVQTAQFGDSTTLSMGETVIAIGNALGQGNTATKGIISATSRDITYGSTTLNVLQTDAAINPGNDGGALVNSSGQVIGINTTKVSSTQVEGIGYAIPSSVAMPIIEQIMNSTDSPALGVMVTTVTSETAAQYNLPQAGVLVRQVVSGGSAATAGIQEGDIITSYNEQPTFTAEELTKLVKQSKVGDTVTIKLYRNGTAKTVSVKMLKSAGF